MGELRGATTRQLRPLRQAAQVVAVVALMLTAVVSCGSPDNVDLDTASPDVPAFTPLSPTAYQRQVVGVGGDTLFAWAVLDPGTAEELELSTGIFGTTFFQVPVDTTAGTHDVLLRNASGDSPPEQLEVRDLDQSLWPAPRIEDVGVFYDEIEPGGSLLLTVSAANLDVDATVSVRSGGSAVTVTHDFPWSAIPVPDQLSHDPATFGYPIFHYLQRMFRVEGINAGDELEITVTNTLDGLSDVTTWTVPEPAELDSDGDGILDIYDGGIYTSPDGGTVDLAALGTHRYRKDILLEVDWIDAAEPDSDDWELMEDAFAAAPVLNPNGSRGINLIIDRGQGGEFTEGGTVLPDHTTIDFDAPAGSADFHDLKSDPDNFDQDRLEIFHYLIFGRDRPNGSSGRGEIIGNDSIVTFTSFSVWGDPVAEVGTALHELGHNFSLRHGGHTGSGSSSNERFKPNLTGVMNYRWQFVGVDTDCDYAADGVIRYSEGDRRDINEASADETTGYCDGVAVDFNGDADALDTGAMNINWRSNGDTDSNDLHDDADQWGNLRLNFVTDPDTDWDND